MAYNGWTNYETWNVALWIGNDEGSSRYWTEQAQTAWDDAEADRVSSREEHAIGDLAEQLQAQHEEAMPLSGQASVWSDLLGAALSEVNWHEIAKHYIDDTDRTEEGTDDEK